MQKEIQILELKSNLSKYNFRKVEDLQADLSTSTQKWHNLNDKLEQLRREKEREIETLKINHDNTLSTLNTQLDDMVGINLHIQVHQVHLKYISTSL